MLTLGVVKNIIPAVASTNAIVAAACVNEAIKVLSFCSQSLNTYMMYMGSTGIYSHTFVYEKKEDCPVCCSTIRKMTVSPTMSLNELLQALRDGDLRLKNPSVTAGGKTLYMQRPPALEIATRPNLDKSLSSLIASGDELTITDPLFPGTSISLSISFD
jgi:ubiquitin-activating enzyme E1 C